MFRFNFDIDDAEDTAFGPTVGLDTIPAAQIEKGHLENIVAEHSASEVSLHDLVGFLILGTLQF